jgi:hypothetical protein
MRKSIRNILPYRSVFEKFGVKINSKVVPYFLKNLINAKPIVNRNGFPNFLTKQKQQSILLSTGFPGRHSE